MPIELDEVVPWGRSMEEYVRMFDLRESDLSGKILGVGDGPASFNAEMNRLGRHVVSCDPVYLFSPQQIRSRVQAVYPKMIQGVRECAAEFVWGYVRSPDHLGEMRMIAMEKFLADFQDGKREGRYLAASLPRLPFADGAFDLAVCSHLLFLYSDQLSREFHIAAVKEMRRVAKEVRIFLLLKLGNERSPHVEAVVDALRESGLSATVKRVPYEFQKGGNEMLVIG
jgi:SAM-dependent methyltransferase